GEMTVAGSFRVHFNTPDPGGARDAPPGRRFLSQGPVSSVNYTRKPRQVKSVLPARHAVNPAGPAADFGSASRGPARHRPTHTKALPRALVVRYDAPHSGPACTVNVRARGCASEAERVHGHTVAGVFLVRAA